jgi:glutaredoxin 2
MALIFFERVGHEGRRPSPFSWRIRYALAHKGVDFEVRPLRFADVGTIRALTGQHLTPVLSDGDHVVHETWDIACYLEEPATLRCSAVQLDAAWPGTSTSGRTRNSVRLCAT